MDGSYQESPIESAETTRFLFPEIPLQQALKALTVPGFVTGHLRGYAPPGYARCRGVNNPFFTGIIGDMAVLVNRGFETLYSHEQGVSSLSCQRL